MQPDACRRAAQAHSLPMQYSARGFRGVTHLIGGTFIIHEKFFETPVPLWYSIRAFLSSSGFNRDVHGVDKRCRSISHSHRVTNRVFRPNVQKITIKDKNGRVRRANVCTRCMKAGKVERA